MDGVNELKEQYGTAAMALFLGLLAIWLIVFQINKAASMARTKRFLWPILWTLTSASLALLVYVARPELFFQFGIPLAVLLLAANLVLGRICRQCGAAVVVIPGKQKPKCSRCGEQM